MRGVLTSARYCIFYQYLTTLNYLFPIKTNWNQNMTSKLQTSDIFKTAINPIFNTQWCCGCYTLFSLSKRVAHWSSLKGRINMWKRSLPYEPPALQIPLDDLNNDATLKAQLILTRTAEGLNRNIPLCYKQKRKERAQCTLSCYKIQSTQTYKCNA